MKHSSLLAETSQIYKSIEQQIEKGALETDEGKWIERAFGLVMKTWLDIEELIGNYRFLNREGRNIFL